MRDLPFILASLLAIAVGFSLGLTYQINNNKDSECRMPQTQYEKTTATLELDEVGGLRPHCEYETIINYGGVR